MNKTNRGSSLAKQKGEMPIGPILIIALIVIPLVLILISVGQQSGDKLKTDASTVMGQGINPG